MCKSQANIPGWKGSCVSSAVREYSWEIHDICALKHTEITRNTHHHRALTGVTDIEFSVLHVAPPNASTAQRR